MDDITNELETIKSAGFLSRYPTIYENKMLQSETQVREPSKTQEYYQTLKDIVTNVEHIARSSTNLVATMLKPLYDEIEKLNTKLEGTEAERDMYKQDATVYHGAKTEYRNMAIELAEENRFLYEVIAGLMTPDGEE